MTLTDIPITPTVPVEWYAESSLFIWHLLSNQTDGQLALGEIVVRAGGEPPLHIHAREDEAYHVLEGELVFRRGMEDFHAGPGDSVFLPRGIQHGFAVRTPSARVLHWYTPGGLEEAHRAFSRPAPARELPPVPAGPPTPEQVEAMTARFAEHGVRFVGPPLAALLAG